VNREDIFEAFFRLVCTAAEFKTVGRRLQLWTSVTAFPAVFVRHTGDHYVREAMLAKVTINAEIWIYSKAGADPNVAPDTGLNELVDAVEAIMVPDTPMLNTLTLGGILGVQHCWLEGESILDPGDLDFIAKAVLPVKILVATPMRP